MQRIWEVASFGVKTDVISCKTASKKSNQLLVFVIIIVFHFLSTSIISAAVPLRWGCAHLCHRSASPLKNRMFGPPAERLSIPFCRQHNQNVIQVTNLLSLVSCLLCLPSFTWMNTFTTCVTAVMFEQKADSECLFVLEITHFRSYF